MLKRNHRAWVEVDLAATERNTRQLLRLLRPGTALMAVVKADAYGHGAVGVSQAVLRAGATCLGVATIPEGVQLREAGITAPIAILGATHSTDEISTIAEYRLQPTLCSPKHVLVFSEAMAARGECLPVHLKIDTGMTRLGVSWTEALEFVRLAYSQPSLQVASLYSHLATADEIDRTVLDLQHARFQEAIAAIRHAGLPLPKLHLCNTAGLLVDPALHYDMVRVGLGLHGFYPAPHLKAQWRDRLSLRPAMAVKARITQIKEIPAGTGISYGYSFIAPTAMRVATVAIGYADGVPRGLSNRIRVGLHGREIPQVGTITMDQCLIDVSGIPEAAVGDVVTFLGAACGQTAEDWANLLGTISWEILCGFKHRLPRLAPDRVASCEGSTHA